MPANIPQIPGVGPSFAPVPGSAETDARLFEALAAPGPQDVPAPTAAHTPHHHSRGRPVPARRTSSRSRRTMVGGDEDAEFDTADVEAEAEKAAQSDSALQKGSSEQGGGAGFRDRQPERQAGRDAAAQPGPSHRAAADRRTFEGSGAQAAPLAALRAAPPPAAELGQATRPAGPFLSPIVPARLPPQTPAMLERNATAKLPLATRMARAHPPQGLAALFAFKGNSIYSPKKRLAGMLWWADWRAMRGYSRMRSKDAPAKGVLKPLAAKAAYVPAFTPAPKSAPVFLQRKPGPIVLQRWQDRPITSSLSAFPVHCGEPYGVKAALAWQARQDLRLAGRANRSLAA